MNFKNDSEILKIQELKSKFENNLINISDLSRRRNWTFEKFL